MILDDEIISPKFNRGVLTMAIGKPEFVEMAVDMALSYKLFNKEPISCIVDLHTKKIIEEKYLPLFDQLIILPESYYIGRIRKFSCSELSPYDSTIFIDADILILNNISNLWVEAELNNNITMIGDYLKTDSTKMHHGFSISELIEGGNIDQYLKSNSGFFHFMKRPSKIFFKNCVDAYKDLLSKSEFNKKGWLGDEIAIGIVSHQFKVSCFKLPSPMMWDASLETLKKNDDTYPVCHFIAPIPPPTVRWMVARARKLRKLNDIPYGGEKIWITLNNQRRMSRNPTFRFRIKNKLNSYFNFTNRF